MLTPPFHRNDGGRAAAGYKGMTGDCVVRAFAIASGRPYQEVYALVNEIAKSERTGKRKKGKSNARTGVYRRTVRKLADTLGAKWTPTMGIGTGCTVHVHRHELPDEGRYVLNLSGHVSALIDGTIHDTHDPSRNGTRCVYGYWEFVK